MDGAFYGLNGWGIYGLNGCGIYDLMGGAFMAQMDGAVSYCFWEICSKKKNTGLQGSTLSGPRMTTGFSPFEPPKKKTYLVAFLSHILMQLRQPKNVVEVTKVFLQCAILVLGMSSVRTNCHYEGTSCPPFSGTGSKKHVGRCVRTSKSRTLYA